MTVIRSLEVHKITNPLWISTLTNIWSLKWCLYPILRIYANICKKVINFNKFMTLLVVKSFVGCNEYLVCLNVLRNSSTEMFNVRPMCLNSKRKVHVKLKSTCVRNRGSSKCLLSYHNILPVWNNWRKIKTWMVKSSKYPRSVKLVPLNVQLLTLVLNFIGTCTPIHWKPWKANTKWLLSI